jgi:hypothetical protein
MNVFEETDRSLKNGPHLNGKMLIFPFSFFIEYFSIITSIKNNTDKVQIDLSRLPSFEKILGVLEGQLLDGHIFQVKHLRNIRFKRKTSSISELY